MQQQRDEHLCCLSRVLATCWCLAMVAAWADEAIVDLARFLLRTRLCVPVALLMVWIALRQLPLKLLNFLRNPGGPHKYWIFRARTRLGERLPVARR